MARRMVFVPFERAPSVPPPVGKDFVVQNYESSPFGSYADAPFVGWKGVENDDFVTLHLALHTGVVTCWRNVLDRSQWQISFEASGRAEPAGTTVPLVLGSPARAFSLHPLWDIQLALSQPVDGWSCPDADECLHAAVNVPRNSLELLLRDPDGEVERPDGFTYRCLHSYRLRWTPLEQ